MTDLHLAIIIIALIAAIVLVWRGRPARAARDEADLEGMPPARAGTGGGREPVAGLPPAAPGGGPGVALGADPMTLLAPQVRSSPYTERFAEDAAPVPAPPVAKPPASRIVTLLVVSRADAPIAGALVHDALHRAGLVYNPRRQMYQRPLADGTPEGLFTVANILKPGHLDPAHAPQLSTTGLAMFMVLPGPLTAADAFEDMLTTAAMLGTMLGAEVYDQRRRILTAESVEALRTEVRTDFPAAA